MTKDELFNCSFGEYLDNLQLTKEQFLSIKEKEIEMLEKSAKEKRKLYRLDKYPEEKIVELRKFLEKKKENYKKYKEWFNEN